MIFFLLFIYIILIFFLFFSLCIHWVKQWLLTLSTSQLKKTKTDLHLFKISLRLNYTRIRNAFFVHKGVDIQHTCETFFSTVKDRSVKGSDRDTIDLILLLLAVFTLLFTLSLSPTQCLRLNLTWHDRASDIYKDPVITFKDLVITPSACSDLLIFSIVSF